VVAATMARVGPSPTPRISRMCATGGGISPRVVRDQQASIEISQQDQV